MIRLELYMLFINSPLSRPIGINDLVLYPHDNPDAQAMSLLLPLAHGCRPGTGADMYTLQKGNEANSKLVN
jgi:hypothetical protein